MSHLWVHVIVLNLKLCKKYKKQAVLSFWFTVRGVLCQLCLSSLLPHLLRTHVSLKDISAGCIAEITFGKWKCGLKSAFSYWNWGFLKLLCQGQQDRFLREFAFVLWLTLKSEREKDRWQAAHRNCWRCSHMIHILNHQTAGTCHRHLLL